MPRGVLLALRRAANRPLTNRMTEPFVALGRNAILLFVLSGLLAKTLIYLKWPDPTLSLGGWIYRVGLPAARIALHRLARFTRLQTSPCCTRCSPTCIAGDVYLTV